jgi:hypothetical protein
LQLKWWSFIGRCRKNYSLSHKKCLSSNSQAFSKNVIYIKLNDFPCRKASVINEELVSHQLIGSSVVEHTPNFSVQIQLSNRFNVFGHVSTSHVMSFFHIYVVIHVHCELDNIYSWHSSMCLAHYWRHHKYKKNGPTSNKKEVYHVFHNRKWPWGRSAFCFCEAHDLA